MHAIRVAELLEKVELGLKFCGEKLKQASERAGGWGIPGPDYVWAEHDKVMAEACKQGDALVKLILADKTGTAFLAA